MSESTITAKSGTTFRSRKFILVVSLLIAGFYIHVFTDRELLTFLEYAAWLYGLYVGGNVGEKVWVNKKSDA